MTKVTKVILRVKGSTQTKEFDLDHAERILRLRNNGNWEIPENSQFEFKDNAINIKPDKGETKEATKRRRNKQGKATPE